MEVNSPKMAEDLFLRLRNLDEIMILQMKIIGDLIREYTENNPNNCIKKFYSVEDIMQSLLRGMNQINYLIEKLHKEDRSLPGNENYQKLEAKNWEIINIRGQMQKINEELFQFNNTFTEAQEFKTKIFQSSEAMMEVGTDKHGVQLNQQNEGKSDAAQCQDLQFILPESSLLLSEEDLLSQYWDQFGDGTFHKLNCWNFCVFIQEELEMDHKEWTGKNYRIILKVNAAEGVVKSLLNEVINMENQMEKISSNQCQSPEPEEEIHWQETIMMINTQLEEIDNKFVQVNAYDEAEELKRRVITGIEKCYNKMAGMNKEMEKYQSRKEERETGTVQMNDIKDTKPPSPQTPCLETDTSSSSRKWKHVLCMFMLFFIFVTFGFSYYVIIFTDPTLIFETMPCMILGRQRMWKLKEFIIPFLTLEVDDLLPT